MRTIPIMGPQIEGCITPLVIEERYKMFSYADDIKPGVTDMEEVKLCIRECDKLEGASGIILHRIPEAGKIKLLPLGKWKRTLEQQHIPFNFVKISDFLDCVGVKLYANYNDTRKYNAEALIEKVRTMVNI